MASYSSSHFLSVQSLNRRSECLLFSSSSQPASLKLPKNPNRFGLLRAVPPSSSPASRKHSSTPPQAPEQEPEASASGERVRVLDPDPPPGPSFFASISIILHRLRGDRKVDELGLEVLSIALPAALALAADPITSLVDTAFVGHLGSVELAAVGVSVSVFNLVSKLFNVPLLNITTSFVAEERALLADADNESAGIPQDCVRDYEGKKLLPSASTSLALAAGIGFLEAVILFFGSGYLLNIMGFTHA